MDESLGNARQTFIADMKSLGADLQLMLAMVACDFLFLVIAVILARCGWTTVGYDEGVVADSTLKYIGFEWEKGVLGAPPDRKL